MCYNKYGKDGDIMKKVVSWTLFILAVLVFVLDVYGAVAGVIDVQKQYAELEARGASGHEYLGVGAEVIVIGVLLCSIVGLIISAISSKIAQNRIIKTVSLALVILFSLLICGIFMLPMLI